MHVLLLSVLALGCRISPASGGPADSAPEPGTALPPSIERPCAGELVWRDHDGDGYGAGTSVIRCPGAPGYVAKSGDCDDTDGATFPRAPEVCGDGHFQDCDRETVCRYEASMGVGHAGLVITAPSAIVPGGHGDFDGDGLQDLVFESAAQDLDDAGHRIPAVYLHLGSSRTGALVDPADADLEFDGVGRAGWLGDVTGDRRDDLLIPLGSNRQALVLTWPLVEGQAAIDQSVARLPALKNATTGWAGVGDVDGDGINDVVEGDFYYNDGGDTTAGPDDGAAFLFLGPFRGETTVDDAATVIRGHDDQHFGDITRHVGDLDGDGRAEFEVGAPQGPGATDGGEVFVFSDPPRGTVSADDANARLFGLEPDGVFAGTDATGGNDVDGDGYGDLVVGAMGWPTSRIGAWLVRGPLPDGEHALDNVAWATFVTSNGSDGYGGVATVLPGDMDGDGYDEVVLGWDWACRPDGSSCPGATSIFYGPVLEGAHDWRDAEGLVWGSGNLAEQAGRMQAIGDFDGDGLPDVALGGASYGPNEAYILLGAAP